jgi:putative exporter of polyketide antibiotics
LFIKLIEKKQIQTTTVAAVIVVVVVVVVVVVANEQKEENTVGKLAKTKSLAIGKKRNTVLQLLTKTIINDE